MAQNNAEDVGLETGINTPQILLSMLLIDAALIVYILMDISSVAFVAAVAVVCTIGVVFILDGVVDGVVGKP